LKKQFVDKLIDHDLTAVISKLRGYVVEDNGTLFLCDHIFHEWLIDVKYNRHFVVDLKNGHFRLAEYGWNLFSDMLEKYGESTLSSMDIDSVRYGLPEALKDTLGHHVAFTDFLNSCENIHHAPVLLTMTKDPEDAAVIANAIRVGQRQSDNGVASWKKKLVAGSFILSVSAGTALVSLMLDENDNPKIKVETNKAQTVEPSQQYDSKSLIAMELLSQSKRIDQYLLTFKSLWSQTQQERLMKIWDGRDGSQNKSVKRKQQYMTIEAENILNSLNSQFEASQLSNIIPTAVTSSIGADIELRQDIEYIYNTIYTVMEKTDSFTKYIKELKECRTLDSFKKKMEFANKAGYETTLWLKLVYVKQLMIMDQLVQSGKPRELINQTLAVLEELSPKNLTNPNILNAELVQLLAAIKRTHEIKKDDINNLQGKLSDMQKEMQRGYDNIRKKCVIEPTDEPAFMWGKIIRLIGTGLYADASLQLDKYLKYNNSPNNKAVVNSAKAYLEEAEKRGLNYGIMVHFIENDAKHSFLQPGDIITHVDCQLVQDDVGYISLREKSGNLLKDFTFLRLSSDGKLKEHKGEQKLLDPRFAFTDMTEQME